MRCVDVPKVLTRELVNERERREHVDDKFCAGKEPALAHDFGLAGAAEHLDDTTVVCALRNRSVTFLLVVPHHLKVLKL